MIKLVKNDFFIYCKEAHIESHRSFYGSFSLGPFDAGQSITIANALRRTLLSELKGLAITSAEIEGAFHEYSTLPGVRDSVLDILLNLKDIVLKPINFGNKKKGTSYAATFKNEQIGYLKTRGPGIVTASELKLPPGIQCVDPDQYIATLSEEGILNIKFNINEGKNYVIQTSKKDGLHSSYSPYIVKAPMEGGAGAPINQEKKNKENSIFSNLPVLLAPKKDSVLMTDEKIAIEKSYPPFVPLFSNEKKIKGAAALPSPPPPPQAPVLIVEGSVLIGEPQGVDSPSWPLSLPFLGYKRRRLWLKKLRLINTIINLKFKNKIKAKSKASFRNKEKDSSIANAKEDSSVAPKKLTKKPALNTKVGSVNSQGKDLKNKRTRLLHSGGALAASYPKSMAIDAVFMPVNKVNYIIEINEQSVMAKDQNIAYAIPLQQPSYNIGEKLHLYPLLVNQTPTTKESKAVPPISKELEPAIEDPRFCVTKNKKQFFFRSQEARRIKNLQLSDNQTTTLLKNNIILEIWTNGSIHPRQALYEACKNLLSLFSKLEKATPLAFTK